MKTMKQLITAMMLLICVGAYSASPNIISFSPVYGSVGTLVTVTGTNLSSPTTISIGGVSAIVVSNTSTSIVGMVMPGAATGSVSVTTSGGVATASGGFTVMPTPYPASQLGNKLTATGEAGASEFGYSVSLSADGNTAIVGGYPDNGNVGAAWIFTQAGGIWSQQGTKLVGTGAIGASHQGWAVSISADGNTAAVGGWNDNGDTGAVWIFIRRGSTWSQQGSKLVGTGSNFGGQGPFQGWSVALSADGNTMVEGGPNYNSETGAVWVFTRSDTTWSQDGPMLHGTPGFIDNASQGYSVAISADAKTVIEGGPSDSNGVVGAAWVFTKTGGVWTQQAKLVGTGYVVGLDDVWQGYSVALSADGNTAAVGGWYDNSYAGAVWVFTRTGTTWTQQGNKLVGSGAAGIAQQGVSLGMSADGNTLMVGGLQDNGQAGASWVYTRAGGIWTQQGQKLVGAGASGTAYFGMSALSADGSVAVVGGSGDNGGIGAVWVFTPCNTCGGDSVVWPGDADANHIVDNNDLLPIGLAYDSTGPVRVVQGTVWQADVSRNWNDSFTVYAPTVNFKYADCNGDGIINAADTVAIMANYSLTHAKTGPLLAPWRNGIPAIKAVVSPDTAYTGDTLMVTFVLGDTNTSVNNIYGLAFRYNFDPLVMDSTYTPSMEFLPTSWIGTPSQKISINKILPTTGQIQAAVTRINHTSVSGHGAIATATFKITTDNISGKNYSYYTNKWSITDVIAIDQYGDPIPLNAGADSSTVGFYPTGIREITTETLHIQPNPARDKVMVSAGNVIKEISLSNIMGQLVMSGNTANSKSVSIDVSGLDSGVYVVQVKTDKGTGIAKLIIEK